jgi:His-Xaa-Ser system radical SAM maturase HxsC
MIVLGTQSAIYSGYDYATEPSIVRISTDCNRPDALRKREAYIVRGDNAPSGFRWYIYINRPVLDCGTPAIELGSEFAHLSDGDILRLAPARNSLRVLFRRNASINSFLLTERCNNYCLMCSQPPRNVDDGWIVDEILEALPLIDPDVPEIMFSGGEPTLLGERFFELVRACKSYLPRTALHILSNGRAFSNAQFSARLGEIGHPDIMVGIPLYSDLAHVHDYVVQADGAYDETLRGILNLRQSHVPVEIRVVLHKQTVPRIIPLAEFITRNLLFVNHVALMGLEMTGFTKANLEYLWIDPIDYQSELSLAVGILDRAKIRTSVYNSQLCLLEPSIWKFARQSISDWKQEYMPECEGCFVKDQCGGFFTSAQLRYSSHISPVGLSVAS